MSNINTSPDNIQANAANFQLNLPKAIAKSDAEVVSQVAATVIKPSGVNETAQVTRETVAKPAEADERFVHTMGGNLNFSIDVPNRHHVERVVNPDTGELVRQLPSEELLKISRDFQRLNNVLVSQRA